MATYLEIAIANLINLFNPKLVVIGGPVARAGKLLEKLIYDRVRQRAMAYPFSVCQIRLSSLGAYASAVGAAVLVLQQANRLLFETV